MAAGKPDAMGKMRYVPDGYYVCRFNVYKTEGFLSQKIYSSLYIETIFLKMDNFASCFRRVYTRKELLDHLPQIMISWSEARSGRSAKAAGIPALKE
jgi:hypothetical protein